MLISKCYLQMNIRQDKRNKMMVTIAKIDGNKNAATGRHKYGQHMVLTGKQSSKKTGCQRW